MKGLKPKPPLLIIPEPCGRRPSRRSSDFQTICLILDLFLLTQTFPFTVYLQRCLCLVYPDLVVYELASQVHLLGGASDGEDPGVRVGGGGRVPLQLHVSSRLLVNTLNGFSTCTHTHTQQASFHIAASD